MKVHVIIFLFVALCVISVAPKSQWGRRGKGAGRRGPEADEGCSEWTFTECIASNGHCGRGKKSGTREGETCAVKQRLFKCKVPCNGDAAVETKVDDDMNAEVDIDDLAPNNKRRPNGRRSRPNRNSGGKRKQTKKACQYQRSESWSGCNADTNTKTITVNLKKGDPNECPATKVMTKPCAREGRRRNGKQACKYTRIPWGACQQPSNTMSRTLTLKRGSPDECPATKTESRTCKNDCKYTKGVFSACNVTNSTKTREDKLHSGSADTCEPVRMVTRRCRIKATKKCEFGAWESFGPCQNGVMTKKRPVTSGGPMCERKAVRTRPC